MVTTMFTAAWKHTNMAEELVQALQGYLELYDFMKCDYHSLNKKKAWRQISPSLEILAKLFSRMVT